MKQKLIDQEMRNFRKNPPTPASLQYFRQLKASAVDRVISRGHPRAKGLCQLSGPEAPPVVLEV
jgi:hypothetical protein